MQFGPSQYIQQFEQIQKQIHNISFLNIICVFKMSDKTLKNCLLFILVQTNCNDKINVVPIIIFNNSM